MAQFNDPAAYERYMGGWSRAAGEQFLDWLGQPHGLRWLDNGCDSGIFSELLWQQALPARLDGIDISPELLAHARQRPPQRITLHHGDANALPFAAGSFDATAMALVIVFLADALQAVREMQRVVRSSGMVATYIWDLPHGFPYADAFAALRLCDQVRRRRRVSGSVFGTICGSRPSALRTTAPSPVPP